MGTTGASEKVVYCNHCGTANPPRAAVCCNCGHVHAREIVVPPPKESALVLEQWFWIALRIVCGVGLCVGGVVPLSGATVNAVLLGSIFGELAIPVVIAAVLGNGNWARSSRWFLGVALAVPVLHYVAAVFGRIHFR